jgi:hypothetical protein
LFSGEGSLIAFLRKKVWALSLTAGNQGDGVEFNATCSIFAVTVTLTKAGHEHVREVNIRDCETWNEMYSSFSLFWLSLVIVSFLFCSVLQLFNTLKMNYSFFKVTVTKPMIFFRSSMLSSATWRCFARRDPLNRFSKKSQKLNNSHSILGKKARKSRVKNIEENCGFFLLFLLITNATNDWEAVG